MHHELYKSTRGERGVQKNIRIQYLKGGTEVYLKSGALFEHHACYFIVCLYLLPLYGLVCQGGYESRDLL